MKRILLAPDKFKGSLRADEICHALSEELEFRGARQVEVVSLPISDGGDGFTDAMQASLGGKLVEVSVHGPLGGVVQATYAMCDGTAVMEMARASGLALLGTSERDPWRASTWGTGEMLLDAKSRGADKVLLGIGGSATNDGGAGMAGALGYRFYNAAGEEVTELPARLNEVIRVVPPKERGWPEIVAACDVSNPLLGPLGATRVYGPQKGITQQRMEEHEKRLERLINICHHSGLIGRTSFATSPGSGAAGGLGFGLMAFTGATLESGFDLVARSLELQLKIESSDLLITAEGRLDRSSLNGKAPVALAKMAKHQGKPTICFCGSVEEDALPDLSEWFDEIIPIAPSSMPIPEAMQKAAALLRAAANRIQIV